MKKIIYFWIILLFTFSMALGQTKGKTTVQKSAGMSGFAEAENAWKVFFPKFRQAVLNREYGSIKAMMKVSCECGGNDECLADWRKATPTCSGVTWGDFAKTISGKVCKLSKGVREEKYEFSRYVREADKACVDGGGNPASFVFIKGIWYLQSFTWEQVE